MRRASVVSPPLANCHGSISKINMYSLQALQQYLFLLHELGVGAVVDDILPKAWSREN